METVANAAAAAANTVQRAIFGNRAAHEESISRDGDTQHIGRNTAGANAAIDEPHRSRETATNSNPFRHSTGAPEPVTPSPYNQRDKGGPGAGPPVYNTNSSAFSEHLPEATDHSPHNTDNVSTPGGNDALKVHHGDLGDRSTRGKTELNTALGETEPRGHGTHSHSASLGGAEPRSREVGNQPSGLGKTEPGKMELGSNDLSTDGASFGKGEHSSTDLGKTEGKPEFGKTEFAESAQGKTELGNFSNYSANPDRNTDTSDPLASNRGRKEPGTGHGSRASHTPDFDTSPDSGLSSGLTGKSSSANETTGQSHLSQPSTAASTANAAPGGVAGVIGDGPGAAVEPSAGVHPNSGARPTHKQLGADKPLEEPYSSGDDPNAAASNAGDLKPLGSGVKLDNESHGEGTGEKYERSTGLAADGGDFDATRPGAGKEADRLLEEKGIHRAAKGSTNLEEEKAKKRHGVHQKAPGESQGPDGEHKGLTTKIKGFDERCLGRSRI
ncbi:unnamed protein product [Tuber aestivum]|uniref:Uncharacterized protein n=1 Tax=Tuber aestivum TaxID=59557 RepID=A0A292Q3Q0_9PEZI|nr:unnamed protein product [Tuber aestivum]